jgi:hypothetical protein
VDYSDERFMSIISFEMDQKAGEPIAVLICAWFAWVGVSARSRSRRHNTIIE